MFGGVPGEDLDMQNPKLRSKIAKSVAPKQKNEKTELKMRSWGGVHDLQIFSWDFVIGFPRIRPGLTVDSISFVGSTPW